MGRRSIAIDVTIEMAALFEMGTRRQKGRAPKLALALAGLATAATLPTSSQEGMDFRVVLPDPPSWVSYGAWNEEGTELFWWIYMQAGSCVILYSRSLRKLCARHWKITQTPPAIREARI